MYLNEIAGRGLEHARLYVKRVVGIDFLDSRGSCQALRSLYKFRNEFIDKDAASIGLGASELKLLVEHEGGGTDQVERVALTLPFFQMALANARTFFSDLDAVLPDDLRSW
jgi:hypothetical protein